MTQGKRSIQFKDMYYWEAIKMNMIKRALISSIIFTVSFVVQSQQRPQFTQYMYNSIAFNPAYAGSREYMVVNLLHRSQWLGIDGAPTTQTLSAHTLIPDLKNIGVGLSVVRDELGFESTTDAFVNLSYTIDLDSDQDHRLAFGVKAGATKYDLNEELLNDPAAAPDNFIDTVNFSWLPNAGVGLYFRGEYYYLGLSIPKIFTYESNDTGFVSFDRSSVFLNGGYLLEASKHLSFKPMFLIKYTDGAPLSFDLSAMFLINEKLWLGGSYRFTDSFGLIANFEVAERFSIGYSYDYITSNLGEFSSGSHELILAYMFDFPRPACKCKDLYN